MEETGRIEWLCEDLAPVNLNISAVFWVGRIDGPHSMSQETWVMCMHAHPRVKVMYLHVRNFTHQSAALNCLAACVRTERQKLFSGYEINSDLQTS